VSKDYSVSDTQWSKSSTAVTVRLQKSVLPQKEPSSKLTSFSTPIEILKDTSSAILVVCQHVCLSYGINTVRLIPTFQLRIIEPKEMAQNPNTVI